MVKLSARLMRLAGEVQMGDKTADIGTDHGLLPIFLYENQVTDSLILCDINQGPLEKARENIQAYGAVGLNDLRQGDGLSPLEAGEVDTVIIAGMGGFLIIDILNKDIEKTKSFQRLVLQPRNAPEKLRAWLFMNGFSIEREFLVREGKYICEIFTAVPRNEGKEQAAETAIKTPLEASLEMEISPLLFKEKNPLLVEFLDRKIKTEKKIINQIRIGAGKSGEERILMSEERLAILFSLREEAGRLL